jgi:hypothetical protein
LKVGLVGYRGTPQWRKRCRRDFAPEQMARGELRAEAVGRNRRGRGSRRHGTEPGQGIDAQLVCRGRVRAPRRRGASGRRFIAGRPAYFIANECSRLSNTCAYARLPRGATACSVVVDDMVVCQSHHSGDQGSPLIVWRFQGRRARAPRNLGIPGIPGNVVCVTYRI